MTVGTVGVSSSFVPNVCGHPLPKTEDSKLLFTDKKHTRSWRKRKPDGEGEGGGGKKWKRSRLTPVFQQNDH